MTWAPGRTNTSVRLVMGADYKVGQNCVEIHAYDEGVAVLFESGDNHHHGRLWPWREVSFLDFRETSP